MTQQSANALVISVIVIATVLLPWLAMSALVPTLEASGKGVENYRGHRVVLGLGLVWLVWAAGAQLGALALAMVGDSLDPTTGVSAYGVVLESLPLVLVMGAMAFGFADDIFGSGAEKGFRGHLAALGRGRLTTGGLKLLGIGLLAIATVEPDISGIGFAVAALQVLAIALTANLLNLADLRPGRALKVYSVLAIAGAGVVLATGDWLTATTLLIALLGPVLAVWRFDLGERAMLGDAGSNAAGALLGWVASIVLLRGADPSDAAGALPWALGAYVVVVLVLNVLSERVSFSRVIEGNAVLRWLDGLGRRSTEATSEPGTKG